MDQALPVVTLVVLLAQTGLFIWVVREIRVSRRLSQTYLAHALRTPLSVILGTLATVQRHSEKLSHEELCRLLETAATAGDELNRLITGLISLQEDQTSIRLEEDASRKSG